MIARVISAAILGFAVFTAGCASTEVGGQVRLGFDATVVRPNRPAIKHRRGEVIDVGTEAFFVESPGLVPVYIVPPPAEGVEPPTLPVRRFESANARPVVGQKLNQTMSDLLAGVNETQILLRAGRNQEALARVDGLMETFPGVAYLQLLRASTLTVMGRRNDAKEQLRSVIAAFPDDVSAQALLAKLEAVGDPKAEPPTESAVPELRRPASP